MMQTVTIRAPRNQAERPPLVTRDAVMAAISVIATAPGQNCRFIRDKPTAPASPWQNGFAERLIGSIRRECVDHIISNVR